MFECGNIFIPIHNLLLYRETQNDFKYVRNLENPGLLVVISNDNDTLDDQDDEKYTNRPTGVKEDVRQLVTTFLDFGFDVLVKRNSTKNEILETMFSGDSSFRLGAVHTHQYNYDFVFAIKRVRVV